MRAYQIYVDAFNKYLSSNGQKVLPAWEMLSEVEQAMWNEILRESLGKKLIIPVAAPTVEIAWAAHDSGVDLDELIDSLEMVSAEIRERG